MRKYNIAVPLDIQNSDDILLYGSDIKYDLIESSKHISDNAKRKICHVIKNDNVRTVVFHSGTGTGKTTSTEDIVNYYVNELLAKDFDLDDCGIVSVVTRRSMDACHQKSFDKFDFVSYQNCHTFENKYITSLEHLKYYNDDNHSYGIVILDEINSLLSYIYSSTLNGRRKDCLRNLCHIIQNASLVICSDANITSMAVSSLRLKGDLFGKIFYYKNTFKNKVGVNMNIYHINKKNYSENSCIAEFCKLIEADVREEKSVLIFSDSKDISIKIKEILMTYNKRESYYKLFNKNEGTIDEIVNCNQSFLNFCVICSPKIIYGVDVLIKYKNVYCVYKYNNSENSMSALGYHQQYSRSRNVENINILILDPHFLTNKNYFVTFEEHKKEEEKEFKNYKKYQSKLCKKYDVLDELCSKFGINGVEIDNASLFAEICLYKTWFDKLFSNNKFQLVLKIAEENGYHIELKELAVTKEIKGLNKCLKKDKIKISKITESIVKGNECTNDDRIRPNIIEQIKAREKLLKINEDEISDKQIELLCDDKKFQAYINKRYLDLSEDDFNKTIISFNNNDLAYLAKDNKIIGKIKSLQKIESLLSIKRYGINNINKEINLDNVKAELLKILKDIIVLFEGTESKTKITKRIQAKINKIKFFDQLQKFMADCYNSFGDTIKCDSEFMEKVINGEKIRRNVYSNFKITN